MKALLLHPIVPFRVLWGKFHRAGGFILPIGLLSIASYAKRQGFDVEICDTGVVGLTEIALRDYLKKSNYDVIGIQCFTNTIAYSFETAKLCKEVLPDATIVLGGVHATILPEQSLKECVFADIAVIGEGEETFVEILKWKRGEVASLENIKGIVYKKSSGIIRNASRQPIEKLDEVSLPDYSLLPLGLYLPHPTQCRKTPAFPVIASRGCPYSCIFCSASIVHGKKLRYRTMDNLMKEIDVLVNDYGAKSIFFQDSSLTTNRKFVEEFCHKLIAEKKNLEWMCNARVDQVDLPLLKLLKKSGCWQINYGIESGNEESLLRLKKNQTLKQIEEAVRLTKKAGLSIMAFYILGLPGEDELMVLNTIKLAKKLATETALFYLPIPYPGTELMQYCRDSGGLRKDSQWKDYSAVDFSNPIYINPLLGKEKMIRLYNHAIKSYYLSPKVVLSVMKSIKSKDDVLRYVRAIKALLGIWFN